MRSAILLFLVLVAVASPVIVQAQETMDSTEPPVYRSLPETPLKWTAPPIHTLRTITQSLAREDYSSLSFLPSTPNSFSDLSLSATASLAQYLDLGDPVELLRFLQESEKAEELWAGKFNHERTPVEFLFYGSLQGAMAQYYMDVLRQPLKALGPAQRSAEAMRTALEMDPDLVGASISLALFEFWRSNALRGLSWTPFVADKRNESIATLYDIARGDSPYRVSAAIGLSWALIELDRPLEAASLADSMCTALGQSPRGLLEPAGKAYYLAERWGLARARYDSLLTSLRNVSRFNLTREVGILHRLAHIAAAQKDWAGVIAYADDALALPLSEDQWDRKKDDRKRLEKLRKQARNTLNR